MTGLSPQNRQRLLQFAVPGGAEIRTLAHTPSATVVQMSSGPDVSKSPVVVKVLRDERAGETVKVHHRTHSAPGLVPLLRAGAVGEYGYLVYPYYARTFADLISSGGAMGANPDRVFLRLAEGVERLHALGLVHGDISATNVQIDDDGSALLADLDDVAEIGTPATRGTPGFCPPEQVAGAPLTPEVDRYAFAVLVGLALIERAPPEGRDGLRKLRVELEAAARKLVPAGRQALFGCLSADPGERRSAPSELLRAVWPQAAGAGYRGEGPEPANADRGSDAATTFVLSSAIWPEVDLQARTRDRLPIHVHTDHFDLVPAQEPPRHRYRTLARAPMTALSQVRGRDRGLRGVAP